MRVTTVGVLADRSEGERRVPLVPEGARRLGRSGFTVLVETGAGERAWFTDAAYAAAGASVVSREEVLDKGQIVLALARPPASDLVRLKEGQILVGLLGPQHDQAQLADLAGRGVLVLSMERLPRTVSRAQAFDVLTSQAAVAGYRAAVVAAAAYGRYFPMLITAAGTSRPARVLVLGAGVAGLSAIGTARRMGAVVTAYDVRPEARGEATSLGARFLELGGVGPASGEGGYARALTEEESRAQRAELESRLAEFDIVITTAAVPGGRPPLLVTAAGVAALGPGSVIVDMGAGPLGGNVEGSVPSRSVVTGPGVTIVGAGFLAAEVPTAASEALSANMTSLLATLVDGGELVDPERDEVLAALVVGERSDEPVTAV